MDLPGALTQFFMPHGHRVVAGRNAAKLERAIGAGDRKIRMRHHAGIRAHPLVYVALHRHHHFRPREPPFQIGRFGRLLLAPFAVFLRQRMDIVRNRIAVPGRERLPGANPEHSRHEHAAALIEHDGFLRRLEVFAFEAALNVHERIRQPAVLPGDHRFVVDRLARMCLGAGGFRVHGDHRLRRLLAAKTERSRSRCRRWPHPRGSTRPPSAPQPLLSAEAAVRARRRKPRQTEARQSPGLSKVVREQAFGRLEAPVSRQSVGYVNA